MVSLLDYGAGNYQSIRNAINRLGFTYNEIKKPEDISRAQILIFPGVGAFGAAKDILSDKKFLEPLKQYLKEGRPFLGICIGMQLLFEGSSERGFHEGLGVIKGKIDQFQSQKDCPVPQMGWNTISPRKRNDVIENIIASRVYYLNSYRAIATQDNQDWILATSTYGGQEFVAVVNKGDVYATQFHPEKSGEAGLQLLSNFLGKYCKENGNVQNTRENLKLDLDKSSQQGQKEALTKGIAKRVIACLDVRSNDEGDLVVTKGDQYDVREVKKQEQEKSNGMRGIVRNLGKPAELAQRYYNEGADEIIFLNITGFRDFPLNDQPMLNLLSEVSKEVYVPLCVGGGIRAFKDTEGHSYTALEVASRYFRSGADKVSIGSEAVIVAEDYYKNNKVKSGLTSIEEISNVYGSQAMVISIDPKRVYVQDPNACKHITTNTSKLGPNGEQYCWWQCTIKGGREGRDIGAVEVAQAMEDLGAGEILLNCIDNDGQKQGFDLELCHAVASTVSIPVVASSGAGTPQHFVDAFQNTKVNAALAAGIFHRKEVSIMDVKRGLDKEGIATRF